MKQTLKQTIGVAAAKVGQFVDEHKKGITAGVGGLAAVAQLLAPNALAAQEAGQTRNNNYQAVVGRVVEAYVINIFYNYEYGKAKADVIIYDVDGNGNTTNDQKVGLLLPGYARQQGIRVGTKVSFTETTETANSNKLTISGITTIDGQHR